MHRPSLTGDYPRVGGEKASQQEILYGQQDHPRACGEKNKELEGVWLPMESPPRGRGKDT